MYVLACVDGYLYDTYDVGHIPYRSHATIEDIRRKHASPKYPFWQSRQKVWQMILSNPQAHGCQIEGSRIPHLSPYSIIISAML